MIEQEIKNLWKNASAEYQVNIDKTLLIFRMDKELDKMSRIVKFRNIRETLIAVIVIIIFCYSFSTTSILLLRIGLVLSISSVLYSLYKMYKVRSLAKEAEASSSIIEQLEASKKYWLSESLLLKSVHKRFVLLLPGYVCVVWATTWGAGMLTAKFIFFVAIGVGLYYVNRRAEKKSIQPLLKKIDDAIAQLEQ